MDEAGRRPPTGGLAVGERFDQPDHASDNQRAEREEDEWFPGRAVRPGAPARRPSGAPHKAAKSPIACLARVALMGWVGFRRTLATILVTLFWVLTPAYLTKHQRGR